MTPDRTEIERIGVVTEALSWIGTPYHNHGRVKGRDGGADCLTFLVEVFERQGLIEPVELPTYAPQWHLHQQAETYLEGVLRFCVEMPGSDERIPLPGDIVLWKFGHCFSHGAIVVDWPTVVHALMQRRLGRADADRDPPLTHISENVSGRGAPRPRRVFTLRRWVA